MLACTVQLAQVGLVHVFHHPNVVAVEEVFEDQSAVHIVMELCSGGDLSEFMRSHSNPDHDGASTRQCSEQDAACIIGTVLQVGNEAQASASAAAKVASVEVLMIISSSEDVSNACLRGPAI